MLVPSRTKTEGSLELVRAKNLPKRQAKHAKNFSWCIQMVELNESETMNR